MSSVSWMAEKSTNELIPLLKNAFNVLKDKEKDLILAAEIGKSLLENNIKLKTSYEELLQQTRSQANHWPPSVTPATSFEVQSHDSGIDGSDGEEEFGDGQNTMRFIPSRGTREAMIEVLEQKNAELTRKLEATLEEQQSMTKTDEKEARKLETEIFTLQSHLEIASARIQELEEINARQQRDKSLHIPSARLSAEDELCVIEDLYAKIDQLEVEKAAAQRSKHEVEDKLATTLKDLRLLKEQFEQCQFTQADFENLQAAYDRQFRHIAELNESLEEHRTILQKLRDRGVNISSTNTTPAPSCHGSETNFVFRHSLLSELENEWHKRNTTTTPLATPRLSKKRSFANLAAFRPLRDISEFTEQSLAAFYNVPNDLSLDNLISKTTGIDPHLLEEALSFINRIENEDFQGEIGCDSQKPSTSDDIYACDFFDTSFPSEGLYPNIHLPVECMMQQPNTFIDSIRCMIRKLFGAVMRWCRFSIVLTVAAMISFWDGPDNLLIQN
ncbi:uncharacterized protein BYT42DRAFT_611649 [Radiomyces spectabilis]|uniref:uncharacterized protein n=1 Tax=Radiomyces spectabilis TaxID=64574 RepID=UPI00222037C7|nr:uncharacterized protein BYT42DRAFT_611649 [Radiomyces spectabilis]KAI8388628.1 hypothetical protein BYT42DRAFT_611649 [Radiomyces spectabilis]